MEFWCHFGLLLDVRTVASRSFVILDGLSSKRLKTKVLQSVRVGVAPSAATASIAAW